MKELALHILDLANNSISAKADTVEIIIDEQIKDNTLKIYINDNGKGMSKEMVSLVSDPFTTSRKTRKVGLGIPLTKHSAEQCNGYLKIESQEGTGTKVEVMFEYDHIDRPVVGDISSVIMILVSSNQRIKYTQIVGGESFEFDTDEIKRELETDNLQSPALQKMLKEYIESNLAELH
jgi:anti-sigma regulatory factor (Ser/Thr protein kinase)